MKRVLFFIIMVFLFYGAFAQKEYVIIGETNYVKQGFAVLRHDAPDSFFYTQIRDTVLIIDHKFIIRNFLNFPQQFRISVFDNYSTNVFTSEPFFIDEGEQKIYFDSLLPINNINDFGRGIRLYGGRTNEEYFKSYLPLYFNINDNIRDLFKFLDSCNNITDISGKESCIQESKIIRAKIRKDRDSVFLKYVSSHSTSQLNSWLLYEFISKNGYKPVYEDVFVSISKYLPIKVKGELLNILKVERLKLNGGHFPIEAYFGVNGYGRKGANSKLYLFEYWYSSCSPCIRQFNELLPIYKEYHDKGFEIIAISTDSNSAIDQFYRVVKRFKYPWVNILDTNRIGSSLLNIKSYPTSFLVDEFGKIIDMNVSLKGLRLYLDQFLQ